MREHMGLYRGKRLDNGEWVEGCLWQDPDLGITSISWFEYYNSADGLQRDYNSVGVDLDTVGECTGLTDKNGKLIFEGDILKWDEREWGCPYSEIAKWDCSLLSARKHDWKEWCEIIGNIHDNPELLKGGE